MTIAREVRDELAGARPGLRVAASVGPYGAFLADGSEYTGRYGVPASRLRDFHGPRLELLAAAGPDLLAVETIPDLDEAEVLVPLLEELGLPYWFSYSVRGGATCAGQPLADAYAVLAGSACARRRRRQLLRPGRRARRRPPRRRRHRPPGRRLPQPRRQLGRRPPRRWAYGDPVDLALVDAWVAAGARYVGGCCGNGPAEIAALARHLRAETAG